MKGAGRRFGADGGGGPVLDLNGETLTFILDRGRGRQVMGHHPPHHRQLLSVLCTYPDHRRRRLVAICAAPGRERSASTESGSQGNVESHQLLGFDECGRFLSEIMLEHSEGRSGEESKQTRSS